MCALRTFEANLFHLPIAPGSDFFLIWKNNILDFERAASPGQTYWENLAGLSDLARSNTFTLKAIYYLDYAQTEGLWHHKKPQTSDM